MHSPDITFNGVPVDIPFFRWGLKGGGEPYHTTFTLLNDSAQAVLDTVTNSSVSVVCKNEHVEPAVQPWEFSDLHVVRSRRVDEWNVELTLADNRVRFQELRFTGFFNLSREVNDVVTDSSTVPRNTDARTAFRATDFLPHTLKKIGSNEFFLPTLGFYGDGSLEAEPWTALAAIRFILRNWLRAQDSTAPDVFIEVSDNGRQLNNVHFEETKLFTALAQLLALAQANLYVHPDGSWFIYDVHATPFPDGVSLPGGFEGSGYVEASNFDFVRPQNLRIKFPKAFDYHVFFEDTGGGTAVQSEVDALQQLENVVQLPDSVGDYERGEWVTVETALALWNADGWENGQSLTIDDLRRKFWSKRAVRELCMIDRITLNPKLSTRLSTLKGCYRQVFKLPAYLMGFIREWDTTLAATIDPISGTRVSSPVWQDFAYIASTRIGGDGDQEIMAANVPHPFRVTANSVAVFRSDLWDLPQAPAKLRMLDQNVGVFRVVFDEHELGGDRKMYLYADFSTVEEEKTYGDSVFRNRSNLDQLVWNARFRLDTVIRIVPITPDMYLTRAVDMSTVTPGDLGQRGYTAVAPKFYDFPVYDVEAKYAWVFGTTGVEVTDGGFVITSPSLANKRVIDAVAEATAKQLIPTFANRIEGVFRSHEYIPERDRPRGNKYMVEFHMDTKGAIDITSTFLPVASARDRYEFLPDDVRRTVYKEVRRGK